MCEPSESVNWEHVNLCLLACVCVCDRVHVLIVEKKKIHLSRAIVHRERSSAPKSAPSRLESRARVVALETRVVVARLSCPQWGDMALACGAGLCSVFMPDPSPSKNMV